MVTREWCHIKMVCVIPVSHSPLQRLRILLQQNVGWSQALQGVWAAVRAEEMRNALALILFYKWSQQDFLMIGGI